MVRGFDFGCCRVRSQRAEWATEELSSVVFGVYEAYGRGHMSTGIRGDEPSQGIGVAQARRGRDWLVRTGRAP